MCIFATRPFCMYQNIDLATLTLIFDILLETNISAITFEQKEIEHSYYTCFPLLLIFLLVPPPPKKIVLATLTFIFVLLLKSNFTFVVTFEPKRLNIPIAHVISPFVVSKIVTS